ncbi:hypothetical protein EWM64_g8886 [Hericium alpestre]|uniref:Uncharacterized protein n=1 Tax=Hericium alpestre TaxID=135208 RepID=A0A4Y9ZM12_9AGAM|nr:hypothetical protein EWM64_g8886 [Hericium alpestre]
MDPLCTPREGARQPCHVLLFLCIFRVYDAAHGHRYHTYSTGFVTHRNDVPLGTEGFFTDLRQYTFVVKNIVYLITATFGDAIVIYRCYMVWQKWWILLFPGIMITGTSAAGIAAMYYIITFSITDPTSYGHIQTSITVFYAMTLSTNFLCTAVLAFRIWSVNNQVKQYRLGAHVPVLMIIIDSGLTYAVVHFIILVCWAIQNTLNYVFLDMAMPIIAISFYMVIVRISLAKSTSEHVKATLAGERIQHDFCTSTGQLCGVPPTAELLLSWLSWCLTIVVLTRQAMGLSQQVTTRRARRVFGSTRVQQHSALLHTTTSRPTLSRRLHYAIAASSPKDVEGTFNHASRSTSPRKTKCPREPPTGSWCVEITVTGLEVAGPELPSVNTVHCIAVRWNWDNRLWPVRTSSAQDQVRHDHPHRYEFYNTFTMWPKEVRSDLRAGIKAKHQQDYALSERYLRRYASAPLTHAPTLMRPA